MLGRLGSARAFRLGMVLCLALGGAACTTTPPLASVVASADPAARVPAVRYHSVTAGAQTFAPVEPRPWQDLNRKAAPPPNTKGQEQ